MEQKILQYKCQHHISLAEARRKMSVPPNSFSKVVKEQDNPKLVNSLNSTLNENYKKIEMLFNSLEAAISNLTTTLMTTIESTFIRLGEEISLSIANKMKTIVKTSESKRLTSSNSDNLEHGVPLMSDRTSDMYFNPGVAETVKIKSRSNSRDRKKKFSSKGKL